MGEERCKESAEGGRENTERGRELGEKGEGRESREMSKR